MNELRNLEMFGIFLFGLTGLAIYFSIFLDHFNDIIKRRGIGIWKQLY